MTVTSHKDTLVKIGQSGILIQSQFVPAKPQGHWGHGSVSPRPRLSPSSGLLFSDPLLALRTCRIVTSVPARIRIFRLGPSRPCPAPRLVSLAADGPVPLCDLVKQLNELAGKGEPRCMRLACVWTRTKRRYSKQSLGVHENKKNMDEMRREGYETSGGKQTGPFL
jgi:hypothetical protein